MKTKKTINRNEWSGKEDLCLLEHVSKTKPINKGLRDVASMLGRSFAACTGRYYYLKKKETSVVASVKTKSANHTVEVVLPMRNIRIEDSKLIITI